MAFLLLERVSSWLHGLFFFCLISGSVSSSSKNQQHSKTKNRPSSAQQQQQQQQQQHYRIRPGAFQQFAQPVFTAAPTQYATAAGASHQTLYNPAATWATLMPAQQMQQFYNPAARTQHRHKTVSGAGRPQQVSQPPRSAVRGATSGGTTSAATSSTAKHTGDDASKATL
ncbi:unnamed protein product [Amoebophrya sp. A120]|nr:unnamed protein product [Amoebophrya sp. A120]|eukprot:GSA120T00018516001.1